MTGINERELQERLAAMTRWEDGPADVWRDSLDQARRTASSGGRILLRSPVAWIGAVAALLMIGLFLLPSIGVARHVRSRSMDLAMAVPPAQAATPPGIDQWAGRGGGGGLEGFVNLPDDDAQNVQPGFEQPVPLRHVVRKATIELGALDVRTAFLKAALIVSEAGGEYVESSSLTGTGPAMRANLTLRVAADRLSPVLNALRELGTVRSEESRGDDVTAQVVDLDARLRNERRVEAELLELFDKRADAPLQDVLELRSQISAVRLSIEQLVARQQQVARSVSLATVLVIIGPVDAPSAPQAGALGDYFSEQVDAAWTGGLRFLAETLGAVLRALLGGLLCWLVLAALLLAWRQHRRRAAAAS